MTDDQEAELADAEEEVSEEEATEEEEATGLQDGAFVKLNYTARTAESDQLVDTTDPEVAEEEGVDDEGRPFEPRVIVLGEGHMFAAVEDEIRGKEVGDSGHVTIPAAEAFGEYDDSQVRTVSAEKIPEDSRRPGAQVQVDGEQGYINTIIGGRARVDFNHPLAGEDLEYDYEISEVVEDRVEKAQGLMHMFFDVDLDMWFETDEVEEEVPVESDDEDAEPEFETETVEKETLYIESDPQLQMNQQWMFGKQQVAQQLMQHLDIDRVIVQETIDGGMGGMMGGMGGMMGGAGGAGGADAADIEAALEEADIDAEDIEADLDEE
ncbi:peptidylprolyl isomerase [Haloarchaeobius sp. HME9146]|uniref:FKBP-type peptidyl-prolyl cis-trans isomerase n=1 Tax=Haloarchaeobius sp. HME9146 TaxID=2978732 RepID=UPI0021BEFDDE|nr:peptidylprolyl isomerase [Haloarchaeobius sp. HME9146]MCT9096896.1 peptidylprolyl isomerase [Haloarchaeobius sp. HME9146]